MSNAVTLTPHPAKYSDPILEIIARYIQPSDLVLDPFAGTGKLRTICPGAFLNELEPEWANQSNPDRLTIGDARNLVYPDQFFDVIATSPCYGNRMADHHDARDGSKRMTYKHQLGRDLHRDNAGQLQWGTKYRQFHIEAWEECTRVLRIGGLFILNVSNHIRKGKEMLVSEWHHLWFSTHGYYTQDIIQVPTVRMRRGQNYDRRVEFENVYIFERWC